MSDQTSAMGTDSLLLALPPELQGIIAAYVSFEPNING